jgi:hypothetical protein
MGTFNLELKLSIKNATQYPWQINGYYDGSWGNVGQFSLTVVKPGMAISCANLQPGPISVVINSGILPTPAELLFVLLICMFVLA